MSDCIPLTRCTLDLDTARVEHTDGRVARLTPNEVGLLQHLRDADGETVSRATLLQEVWGYHPDVVSRAVDSAVKRLRRKIEVDATEPRHLLSVWQEGYRLVPAEAPEPVMDPLLVELRDRTSFVGRLEQIDALFEAITPGRVVSLLGPGGMGKTRLAQQVARRLRAEGSPLVFVDLSAESSYEGLLTALGTTLGVHRAGDETLDAFASRLVTLVAQEPGVLVLDNVEQIVEAAARMVAQVLLDASSVAVLVTSRRPLGLPSEIRMPLGPLSAAEAADLFRERARAHGATLSADDPDLHTVLERLEGLPLALELAAARTPLLDLPTLAEMLARPLVTLADPDPTGLSRHATLTQAIRWSWDLLGDQDRQALAQLSVFAEPPRVPWTLDIVDVAGGALDALQRLRDHSLLSIEQGTHGARVRLLEVVRAFAAEQLDSVADREAAEARHAELVLRIAGDMHQVGSAWSHAELAGARQVRRDLHLALARALPTEADRAALLALEIDALLALEGTASERLELLERVRAAGPTVPEARIPLCLRLARLRRGLGQKDAERRLIDEARAQLGGTDDPLLVARVELGRARLHLRVDQAAARACLDRALSAARSVDDDAMIARVQLDRGHFAEADGDLERAEQEFRRSAASASRAGHAGIESTARYNVAFLALQDGRHGQAETELASAIRVLDHTDDPRAEVMRGLLPLLALDRGDTGAAVELARVATGYGKRNALRAFQAEDQYVLGLTLHAHGDLEEAERCYDASISHYRALGRLDEAAGSLGLLAALHLERGDVGPTRSALAEARLLLERAPEPDVMNLLDTVQSGLGGSMDRTPLQSVAASSLPTRLNLAALRRLSPATDPPGWHHGAGD